MKHRRLKLSIFAILIILLVVLFATQRYRPFYLDDNGCHNYDQRCSCIGLLTTYESFPPQYACKGLELCRDTLNIVECRELGDGSY